MLFSREMGEAETGTGLIERAPKTWRLQRGPECLWVSQAQPGTAEISSRKERGKDKLLSFLPAKAQRELESGWEREGRCPQVCLLVGEWQ